MTARDSRIGAVLNFWFAPESATAWFNPSPAFDDRVRLTLGPLHAEAAAGRLDTWMQSAEGCLALCILLDQVPRNIFRGTPQAYATDPKARLVSAHAVAQGFDRVFSDPHRRHFLYLPFEHSEDLADQELCLTLVRERACDPEYLRHAERHREIIARFGRFPHRNQILGRASTEEETAFLAQPFSSF